MEFRTIVDIPKPGFEIQACEELLFVGSCFADSIGQRFRDEGFPVTVNPYGTMYNPASILHTIERCQVSPQTVFLTLGTNHVYRLKETGEIVDNCQKRPASLFQEEKLTVDECATWLGQAVDILRQRNPQVHVVLTVSPIRYRKYGYHESMLSKATLLLAADRLKAQPVAYFPAYEIFMDELRDYRFYAPDMLHSSAHAVDYIW
jgi:lysophospholipase L1-like esterase